MEFDVAVRSILEGPIMQKLYILQIILNRAKDFAKFKNRHLMDALVERHVEYCH